MHGYGIKPCEGPNKQLGTFSQAMGVCKADLKMDQCKAPMQSGGPANVHAPIHMGRREARSRQPLQELLTTWPLVQHEECFLMMSIMTCSEAQLQA